MKSYWKDNEAKKFKGNPLKLRVYTSRLLGANQDLVMHGGGNTSVKINQKNLFNQKEGILYVKGSGWDLATIETQGFAPVKLSTLHQMAELHDLSDIEMVKHQRMAMTDPLAPNPSVEAILHAIIPYTYVDHTHADAVVTLTNSPNGKNKIRDIYGDRIMIIPYVMPGFILAKKIYQMTRSIDWDKLDGMILMNHGVFTFDQDARKSYEKMITIVTKAENYLRTNAGKTLKGPKGSQDFYTIARLRKMVADSCDQPILCRSDNSASATAFSNLKDLKKISSRGPITPDHIIQTKRTPLIIGPNPEKDLENFAKSYVEYFEKYNNGNNVILDQAPRWAIIPGSGSLFFGPNTKKLTIIEDIARHTQQAIYKAEQLGGWKPLGKKELFEMEYWSLEQAKLKKAVNNLEMQGKIALVTGAASGIGKACVQGLVKAGAAVAALDKDPQIANKFPKQAEILAIKCDVTNTREVNKAIQMIVSQFGGLDMIVSNAGIFPKSALIEKMDASVWEKSMAVNVNSHQKLLQLSVPFLEVGIDPAVVIIGSKNVPAPGPGASAYSVAKAGLTQLARVAALELGEKGIRVNVIHPNAVYDTAIWTEEVLKARAKHYNLSVGEYKTNNLLKVEVTSKDVANLAISMLGKTFSKITGAQVPIDGGNDRVI